MAPFRVEARQPLVNGDAGGQGEQTQISFSRQLSAREDSPETTIGPLGIATFGWFTGIIDKAVEKNGENSKLDPEDLYPLAEIDKPEKHFERLLENWTVEEQARETKEPSLMRALRKTFFWEVFKTARIQLVSTSLQFVSPLLIRQILSFVEHPDATINVFTLQIPSGYVLAAGLVAASFTQGCLSAHYFQAGYRNGMHIRGALILLAFHKSLRMLPWPVPAPPAPEPTAAQQRRCCKAKPPKKKPELGGMGQMTNIISADTDRFTFLMPYFNVMWSGALQICIAFTMLFMYVGWAVFAGILVMICFTALSTVIQSKARKIQAQVMKAKDERLKLEVEMLKIVKIIKLYAWENTIEAKVKSLRDAELWLQLKFKLWNVFIFISFSLSPVLVSLATFTVYTGVLGHDLDAKTAFPALSLFNILRFPLALLPMVVGFYMQALVAKDRIEGLLLAPEVPQRPRPSPTSGNDVEVKANSLMWPDNTVLLKDVDFCAKKAECVVVVGKTGAGKSGLLYALLGELPVQAEDAVYLGGSIGYCAQSAWVRNASLKNNITGGVIGEEDRYQQVLEACALQADLQALPDGDQTMIGDRGINLSGGQKQRVALARAVFANKDIYVLDDVLSALDGHVTSHICTQLFQGPLMKGKTIVLVTHSRKAMKLANRIYSVSDKELKCFSTFEEFRASGVVDDLEEQDEKEDDKEDASPEAKVDGTSKGGKDAAQEKKTEKTRGSQQEQRRAGSVKFATYIAYAQACGGILPVGFFLVTLAVSEGSKNMSDAWLTKWTQLGGKPDGAAIYGLIAAGSCVCSVIYVVTRVLLGQKGSRVLHEKCVNSLLRAQMSFYDQTPNGQILNRLAEDTVILDTNLPQTMAANFVWFWKAAAIVFMCMLVTPYFILLMIPMFFLYSRIAKRYLPAVRDLRRLDAAARSPIFSHFSETLAGMTTIRAMQDQDRARDCNVANLTSQMEAYFLNNTAARWLSLRLQIYGTVLVFSVCVAGVFLSMNNVVGAGLLGLAITYAMNLTDTLAQVNRESADRETQMVSVERVDSYATEIPKEDALLTSEGNDPSWMSLGNLTAENVKMRYREHLPYVLNGISLKIQAGERVGIVGRTGCGKSSFLTALMRLVEIQDGQFSIDGLDLKKVGLHTLRSKVAIIPQDPAILTGTIRFNLDPFGKETEEDLWTVLEKSQLRQRVEDAGGLDSIVQEGGGNYSVGELQLICMARALLRRKAFASGGGLLLLDEATSALDGKTDDIIQEIIRTDFKCTTITIAHRIQTLMDYDKVVVLDAGAVKEFDAPKALLQKESAFKALAEEGGVDVTGFLKGN